MRKTASFICKNTGADHLHGYCSADQHLYFCYIERTIPLLHKSKFQASRHLLWLYHPGFVSDLVGSPDIRLTCPCNVYPLTPHFYIVKVELTGVFIIFFFLL